MIIVLLVAIADDDARDAALLKGYVEEYCAKNSIAVLTHIFSDGLEFIRSTENHDIVFLDIQMGKLDGLETARLLRKIGKESILIFVTNMAQFAIKGYEVDALDFIIKPANAASITYVMDKAMKRTSKNAETPKKEKDMTSVSASTPKKEEKKEEKSDEEIDAMLDALFLDLEKKKRKD